MTEENLGLLIKSIYTGNSEEFKSFFDKNKDLNISYRNNALLKTMFQILDDEYAVFKQEKIRKIKDILYFILDHKTFTLIDEETKDESLSKTIVIANLLMTFSDDRIKEYESDNLYAPILLTTTALTNKNDIFEQILITMTPTEEAKKMLSDNKEYMLSILTKIIQGRNTEALGILSKHLENHLELFPFDMLMIGTRYGNMQILTEMLPEFSEFKEHSNENLMDLFETSIINKLGSEDVIRAITNTKPIQKFLENDFKLDKYKERKEKMLNYLTTIESPVLEIFKQYI